ncbi:cytochrome c oxidase subunit II [Sphingobium sp.]|uniref:cytochrome c oxidase subunit II n=1 Tax=Sphingobium sp. TaxID=1912891 RepID=UPI003BB6C531
MPVLIVGACAGPLSTLDTAGPASHDVATLWWVMLAGAAMLTLLVLALLLLAFLPRSRPAKSGTRLWVGWLGVAMPGAVLTALLGYALMLGEGSIAHPVPGPVVVEATGHQWYWTFRQPGSNGAIATRGVLHIPAGRPVDVRVGSADVIHSFWVPRLGGKMDAIPGQINILRIKADKPGMFEGQCAEFCGLNHAANRFRVIVHDAGGWARFQREGGR